jgi:hypothetical protein
VPFDLIPTPKSKTTTLDPLTVQQTAHAELLTTLVITFGTLAGLALLAGVCCGVRLHDVTPPITATHAGVSEQRSSCWESLDLLFADKHYYDADALKAYRSPRKSAMGGIFSLTTLVIIVSVGVMLGCARVRAACACACLLICSCGKRVCDIWTNRMVLQIIG